MSLSFGSNREVARSVCANCFAASLRSASPWSTSNSLRYLRKDSSSSKIEALVFFPGAGAVAGAGSGAVSSYTVGESEACGCEDAAEGDAETRPGWVVASDGAGDAGTCFFTVAFRSVGWAGSAGCTGFARGIRPGCEDFSGFAPCFGTDTGVTGPASVAGGVTKEFLPKNAWTAAAVSGWGRADFGAMSDRNGRRATWGELLVPRSLQKTHSVNPRNAVDSRLGSGRGSRGFG